MNNFVNTYFISVLADGSTDKAVNEQIIYTRYVDAEGHLQANLVEIANLDYGHAEGVKNDTLKSVNTVGLTIEDLLRS